MGYEKPSMADAAGSARQATCTDEAQVACFRCRIGDD
jgi:hypothetical protein